MVFEFNFEIENKNVEEKKDFAVKEMEPERVAWVPQPVIIPQTHLRGSHLGRH